VFNPTVKGSLYLAIIIRTTIDSILVMVLRYLIVGLEGLSKGNGFVESTLAFYQGDIKHILAVLCLYWLIVLPYVVYRFLVYLAGEKDLEAYLLARNDQT
jgi:hypothetical protein